MPARPSTSARQAGSFVLLILLPALDGYAAVFFLGPFLPTLSKVYGFRWEQLGMILLLHVCLSRFWFAHRLAEAAEPAAGLKDRLWAPILILLAGILVASFVPVLLGPQLRR